MRASVAVLLTIGGFSVFGLGSVARSPTAAAAAMPGCNGVLAFASNGAHHLKEGLYAISLNGRRTYADGTNGSETDVSPSPNGRRLAYAGASGLVVVALQFADYPWAFEILCYSAFYPLVENHHRDGILRLTRAPAPGIEVTVPAFIEEIIAEFTHHLRRSAHVNQRSGVSTGQSEPNSTRSWSKVRAYWTSCGGKYLGAQPDRSR